MDFKSEVSSCANRPIEVMVWINEIESAKSVADLKTAHSVTGAKLQTNDEVLGSKKASGLKKIINGAFNKRRVSIQKEAAKKARRFLTGRQVAWMIYELFRVNDTDESVLDLSEILKVELKYDNEVQYAMGRNRNRDEDAIQRWNSG